MPMMLLLGLGAFALAIASGAARVWMVSRRIKRQDRASLERRL